jgi:predicted metal-dependent hydrolase
MAAAQTDMRTAIEIRSIDFDQARGFGGLWNPRLPEVSHTLNAFQLALPHLEPYFVDAIKGAVKHVRDPRLRAEATAFCAQEASHSRQHAQYNRVLRRRYPRVEEFEKQIQATLLRSRREDPLATRLAFTAACEAITGELARFLFRHAEAWFRDADGRFAALMLWHAAEEIEHKRVAHDVLLATGCGYGVRASALVSAVRRTLFDLDPIATYMLSVDGVFGRASRWRRFVFRAEFMTAVAPRLVRYALPGYDPALEPDPPFARSWMQAYAEGHPLDAIDTSLPIADLAAAGSAGGRRL